MSHIPEDLILHTHSIYISMNYKKASYINNNTSIPKQAETDKDILHYSLSWYTGYDFTRN
jgi:hypothetical protein